MVKVRYNRIRTKVRNMTVVYNSFDVFELLILSFDKGRSVLNSKIESKRTYQLITEKLQTTISLLYFTLF